MTEKERMIRDTLEILWGNMIWESAIELLGKVEKSDAWIDYLLMEMELGEYWEKSILYQSLDCGRLVNENKSNITI